jgi:high affinity Mn2+ porin
MYPAKSAFIISGLACTVLLCTVPAAAQAPAVANAPVSGSPDATRVSMFAHSSATRYWISGQLNVIFQAKPGFHSSYEGPNSFDNASEYKTSILDTLFLGMQPHRHLRYNTDFILDVEESGGRGLSQALGLASFTNLDVVRNPNIGTVPYLARGEIHQTIGLSKGMTDADRGPLSLASQIPIRRLELRVGKMSLPDIFDENEVASDSHLQFLNWTVDNEGAWDYAADTRGYTVGGAIEYDDHCLTIRYGLFAMPTVANGPSLDWAFSRARAENWEVDWSHSFVRGREGAMRVLAFENHAHMGNYREAVRRYFMGETPTPDIVSVERFGTVKYGFEWNGEQALTQNFRIAGRFGWNDDQEESYVYTEVGQSAEMAADDAGARWHRPQDKVGFAFVSNAIKKDHQNYLKYGGLGFLLGDGKLAYGRENIVESYYNWHAWRGLFYALDGQHINNPGYNRDRGPIWVFSVRGHVEF